MPVGVTSVRRVILSEQLIALQRCGRDRQTFLRGGIDCFGPLPTIQ